MSPWWQDQEDFDATQDVDGEVDYSKWQLERLADNLLREDSKREMCRRCGAYGSETGEIESLPQVDEGGDPQVDNNGDVLYMEFPELACEDGHRWYKGEGKARTIGGKNPILFESHIQDRRRREIYCANGVPDPSIQQGIYLRTHPQGRKTNTIDARRKHGASWYK